MDTAVIAKVNYSHRDMIDFIISNPGIRQKEIGKRYGYSEGWVSQVINSDAFQAAFAARRAEVVDPALTATVTENFRTLTQLSLEKLIARVSVPGGAVSDQTLLRSAELGAKALGIGGNAPPPAPAENRLTILAERITLLNSNQPKENTFDGEFSEEGEALPTRTEGREDADHVQGSERYERQDSGAVRPQREQANSATDTARGGL